MCDVHSVQLEVLHATQTSCTGCSVLSSAWATSSLMQLLRIKYWNAKWNLLLVMMRVTMLRCLVVITKHLLMFCRHQLCGQLVSSSSTTAMLVPAAALYLCGLVAYQSQYYLSCSPHMVMSMLQLISSQAFEEKRQRCIQTYRRKCTIF